ncbi:hypothetical protein KCP78_09755 [Salmonella enterica subsp. enterica]|nr:hypothetical protein KCP78_09755 [Salmonella enterica subsp. enterica]
MAKNVGWRPMFCRARRDDTGQAAPSSARSSVFKIIYRQMRFVGKHPAGNAPALFRKLPLTDHYYLRK